MARSSKRYEILAAASRIVEASGAAHLTLDAVAAEAGLSKGGMLYHFPSKQALLEGMLEQLLAEMNTSNEALRQNHSTAPHPTLIARILEQHQQSATQRAMQRAILAAVAEDPAMLIPARTEAQAVFDGVSAENDKPEMAWVLLLAVEGLRFLEMLKLLPLSKADRERVHQQLLSMAEMENA